MYTQRSRTTKLFGFKLDRNDKNTDDDGDFPVWVRGLRQWPLYPIKQRTFLNEVTEQEEDLAREVLENISMTSNTQIPLTNLINVEALIIAGGNKVLDDERDISIFELNQFMSRTNINNVTAKGTPLSFLSNLQELGDWNNIVYNLRNSISNMTAEASPGSLSSATESIFREATARLENVVTDITMAISPQAVQSLILQAGKSLRLNDGAANSLVAFAEKVAREQGVDVREAAERAKETSKLTTNFVTMANDLLVAGYSREDTDGIVLTKGGRSLFDDFSTAKLVSDSDRPHVVVKAAEMGLLSGAIYEDTLLITQQLGHSIVANGTIANVAWMITDSIGYDQNFTKDIGASKVPCLVRTIVIRGFDASDDNVDREELLLDICTAHPESFGKGVLLHTGLLKIARQIYREVAVYIDSCAPLHKVVISGHSIGGSLSFLLLLLLADERGSDFVLQKIARVYTFGSPPVSTVEYDPKNMTVSDERNMNEIEFSGNVLQRFGLPNEIVFGYIQPWDPIVRLFTSIDPLYPLIGDIGKDGKTLYASGPPRTLRPITRAIIESWDGWPRFRDTFKATANQNYSSVGIQYILLPEPIRYISDQLVSVNVQIPPVDSMLRISSEELLPSLAISFPVDVFRISFVPAAIRSFVHHFYPAYGEPIKDFSEK
jgi:hypothetical protein